MWSVTGLFRDRVSESRKEAASSRGRGLAPRCRRAPRGALDWAQRDEREGGGTSERLTGERPYSPSARPGLLARDTGVGSESEPRVRSFYLARAEAAARVAL